MKEQISKSKCNFCKKEIEIPESMKKAKHHSCFNCFVEREKELSKLEPGKLHVDMDIEGVPPDILLSLLLKEEFPKLWKVAKRDVKEMSKKEVAENMFIAGAEIMLEKMMGLAEGYNDESEEAK